jgi:serine/threonine protein kinase
MVALVLVMHNQLLIHTDIKPMNVLIPDINPGNTTVANVGLTFYGTDGFRAPELLGSTRRHSVLVGSDIL